MYNSQPVNSTSSGVFSLSSRVLFAAHVLNPSLLESAFNNCLLLSHISPAFVQPDEAAEAAWRLEARQLLQHVRNKMPHAGPTAGNWEVGSARQRSAVPRAHFTHLGHSRPAGRWKPIDRESYRAPGGECSTSSISRGWRG